MVASGAMRLCIVELLFFMCFFLEQFRYFTVDFEGLALIFFSRIGNLFLSFKITNYSYYIFFLWDPKNKSFYSCLFLKLVWFLNLNLWIFCFNKL